MLIVRASSRRIYPSALCSPRIVSCCIFSSPRTLMYALHVFKSGATSTATTDVIGATLGSLIPLRRILLSSLSTSAFTRVFLILFFGVRKVQKERDGLIFYSYFMLYSIGRFIIEGIRTDSVLNIGTVPIAQIASVLLFITGAIGCIWTINKSKKLPPV